MWQYLYSFFHAASIYWKTNSESGSTASPSSPAPPSLSVLHRWIGAFCACVIPPPDEEEGSRLVWVESCTTTTCAPAHCMASTPKDRPAGRTAGKREIKGAGREIANNHLRQFQCQEGTRREGRKKEGFNFKSTSGEGRKELGRDGIELARCQNAQNVCLFGFGSASYHWNFICIMKGQNSAHLLQF